MFPFSSGKMITERYDRRSALRSIKSGWTEHRGHLLYLAVGLMTVPGLYRLVKAFSRLLLETQSNAAIDLKYRYEELQLWFSGKALYSEVSHAVYPPASYAMLWPFLGSSSFTLVRWIWGFTTVAALAGLVCLFIRESRAQTRVEIVLVALLPLSMYATPSAVGAGQVTIHGLVLMVAGLVVACRGPRSWKQDVLAGLLILTGLVKPSVAAPFFLLALLLPAARRPALLAAAGYVALSLIAVSFQGFDILSLHGAWIERALGGSSHGAATGGYGSLHNWSAMAGLEKWNLAASLLVLVALGYWTYRHRDRDLWILLGVVAIVARFWTYHRLYDDLLILLPMIALFRIVKQASIESGYRTLSGLIFAAGVVVAVAPRRLRLAPPPWSTLFVSGLTIVWIIMLVFLLYYARTEKTPR